MTGRRRLRGEWEEGVEEKKEIKSGGEENKKEEGR